jgi:hypothetical protein
LFYEIQHHTVDVSTAEAAPQLLPCPPVARDEVCPSNGTAWERDHSARPTQRQTSPMAHRCPHATSGPVRERGSAVSPPKWRTGLPPIDGRVGTHWRPNAVEGHSRSSACKRTRCRRSCPPSRHTSSVGCSGQCRAPATQRATFSISEGGWMASASQTLTVHMQPSSARPNHCARVASALFATHRGGVDAAQLG